MDRWAKVRFTSWIPAFAEMTSIEYPDYFRLRQFVSVLVDFMDGVGDVVDVGFASEQHALTKPDRLLAKLVVVGIVKLVTVSVEPGL